MSDMPPTYAEDEIYALKSVVSALLEVLFENNPELKNIFLRKLRLSTDIRRKNGQSNAAMLLELLIADIEAGN